MDLKDIITLSVRVNKLAQRVMYELQTSEIDMTRERALEFLVRHLEKAEANMIFAAAGVRVSEKDIVNKHVLQRMLGE